MIFKTFDNDIDNMSSKWGMLGNSFSDIGSTISTKWKQVTDYIAVTNDSTISGIVSAWKSSKPLDFLETSQAESILSNYNKALDQGTESTVKFINAGTGNDFIDDFLKGLSGAPATMDKYNSAVKAAAVSQIGLTTSMIASKVAALALNAAVSMGISIAISALVKIVDDFIHSNKRAIESAEELRSKYAEFKEMNVSNVKTINNLKKEFEILSNGVSQYGDNISLTTDQYQRYKEIIQQIIGISPSLAEGYSTENGYIADKNGLLERAIELQEKEYRNELRKITNLDNLETSMSGYVAQYKEAFNGGFVTVDGTATATKEFTDLQNAIYSLFNINSRHDFSTEDMVKQIMSSLGIDDVEMEIAKYYNKYGYFQSTDFWNDYADIIAENIQVINDSVTAKSVGLDDNVFALNIEKVESCAESYKDMKDTISIANESIQTDLGYIAEYANGYSNLSAEQQKFVSEYLKGFNISDITSTDYWGNLVYDKDKMASVKSQIKQFVEELSQNDSTKQVLTSLYSPPADDETMPEYVARIKSAIEAIQKYCENNRIEIPFNISAIESDTNDISTKYNNAVQSAKDKFGINETKFFEENSINTQEEIDKWLEIAGAANSATEAEQEYLNAANDTGSSNSLDISGTIDKLNTQLKPTFDSLKSAYQDIFTENGFVRENIDLSMFSDIKSTLDNLSDLELAVDYSSFEDFVRVLNDTESTEEDIRNAFNDLATSISQVAISGAEDFETIKSALEDFGVENSEMVAFSNLANNTEALKEAGLDIADASKEQMKAFAEEYVAAENVTQAVNMLTYAKQLSQIENMDTSGEIANLKTLAENAGYTGDVIQYLTELEQIYQEIASGTLTPGNLDRKLKRADELQDLIKNSSSKIEYNPTEFVGKSGTSSASSAGQDAADAYLEAFEKELSELDTLKDRGKITEKQYLDALRKLYVKYYNDKEKYLDQYEKYEYQYLSGMKSLYESAFSYIVKQIDKRIDALRKESESQVANLEAQKKAAEEFYQSQIDDIDDQIESIDKEIAAKQDLIDAINDAAEARKREIDLQKAQYDLERMQNQKINYVYKDGQMIYEADSTGIRDARENVEDAKREVEIAAVEKVIEGLEKQRDILEEQKEALEQALEASNAYWDAQIEQTEQYFDTLITGMEEYKSRWEELSEIEENAKMNLALEELGITEQDILGMSTEAFNNVKQAYINILADMYNGNDQLLMQLSALSGIQLSDLTGYLDGTVDALDRLNQMDLEETNKSISGISGSFDSIAASAGSAASAIDGGSGGGDVQDNASGENNTPGNGGGGSGKSILNSIQTLSTEGVDNINKVANAFAGSNEDEQSGVSVAGAVQQVIDKVGSGQAKSKNPNGNDTKAPTGKSSNSLMSAIQDQTEAALDIESGIPAQEKAWENLNEPLDKANELILSIKNSLEGMDGKEFSVTLSVHGPGIIGTVIKGIMGNAEVEGTALLQGDWGAKKSRKSLVGELGQELIVRGSRFFTVGNNGAEMFNVQKGDIIFNHEQTEQLLKHGRISSRGTSYADGTTNTFPDYLTPIDQSSDEYSIFSQFNEYLKKSTDMFSSAGSLHRPLEEIADSVSMIEHTVNNRNMNAMRTFEINIGDINLEGVQDVNSLSAAIVTRLPNLVIQELHRS